MVKKRKHKIEGAADFTATNQQKDIIMRPGDTLNY